MKRQLLTGLGVVAATLAFTATAASAHAASVSCVAGPLVRVHNDYKMQATVTLDDGRQLALPSKGRVDFNLGAAHTYSVVWTDAFTQKPRSLPLDCKSQTTTTTTVAPPTTTTTVTPTTTTTEAPATTTTVTEPTTTVTGPPTTVPEPTTTVATTPAPTLGPPQSIVNTTVPVVAVPSLPATGKALGLQAIVALTLLASGTALVLVARRQV